MMAPKLMKRIRKGFASIFKPAKPKQTSVLPESGDLGGDVQGPAQKNWELEAYKWYLGMMHYYMEREKFDRENEIRRAFGQPPIPSFEYAV